VNGFHGSTARSSRVRPGSRALRTTRRAWCHARALEPEAVHARPPAGGHQNLIGLDRPLAARRADAHAPTVTDLLDGKRRRLVPHADALGGEAGEGLAQLAPDGPAPDDGQCPGRRVEVEDGLVGEAPRTSALEGQASGPFGLPPQQRQRGSVACRCSPPALRPASPGSATSGLMLVADGVDSHDTRGEPPIDIAGLYLMRRGDRQIDGGP
jgi:hypothetical protein